MSTRPLGGFALWLIMSAAAVATAGEDIQHSLTDKYKGQILALRHPLKGTDQQYDEIGNVLSSRSEGPWTVFGRLRIEEIYVEPTRLRIKAARLEYQFDQKTQTLVPVRADDHVKLDIVLSKPVSSESEADSILGTVFALNDKDVLDTAPEFWVQYLSTHLSSSPGQEPRESLPKARWTPVYSGSVYPLNEKGLTAPKPIYTPEPEFTDFAREANCQGTLTLFAIVGPDGLVKSVSIVRPLGMGLDENAVASVSTWRFQPGTMNGEHVAVAMQVEVGFSRY